MWRFISVIINPIELANGSLPIELTSFRPDQLVQIMSTHDRNVHLADELLELPILEFITLENWVNILRMSFLFMRDRNLRTVILQKWFSAYSDNVDFTDVIIFYVLRTTSIDGDIRIREAWIKKAFSLVKDSRDISLLESLIITLGNLIFRDKELLKLASEISLTSPIIQKLLYKNNLI